MFGKKKKEKKEAKEEVIEVDIHTMPAKFMPGGVTQPKAPAGAPTAAAGGDKHKMVGLIIIIGAILLIIAAVAFYFLVIAGKEGLVPVNTNEIDGAIENRNVEVNENKNLNLPAETNVNKNANKNKNVNKNENKNGNENVNTDKNENKNGNENINGNFNINSNANVNASLPVMPMSLDTDKDLLTDKEEDLYATKYVMPDSDSDGFLDGKELLAGYDPTKAEGAKLEDAEFIASYQDKTYSYEVLYPKEWLTDVDLETDKVLFSAALGEFIEILVENNPDKLSPQQWYMKQSPGIEISKIQLVSVGDVNGVKSSDGLNVYLFSGSKVFIISYNIGTLKELNYKTTFDMMVSSFKISKAGTEGAIGAPETSGETPGASEPAPGDTGTGEILPVVPDEPGETPPEEPV